METKVIKFKSLGELKEEKQKRFDKLMDESGMFFAFNDEQFIENKTPLKEGEKYVSIGAGGYMPKGNVDTWIKSTNELNKWYSKEVKNFKKDAIKYELANHECYYTGDIQPAIDALGKGFTEKQIYEVYKESIKEWELCNQQ